MKITKINLSMLPAGSVPVCAYGTVTFDNQLAVHDLRIIRKEDRLFVAMPNRKRTQPCHKCQTPNAFVHRFCSNCGVALPKSTHDEIPATRPHIDIAHPLTADFRATIEREILEQYQKTIDLGEPQADRA